MAERPFNLSAISSIIPFGGPGTACQLRSIEVRLRIQPFSTFCIPLCTWRFFFGSSGKTNGPCIPRLPKQNPLTLSLGFIIASLSRMGPNSWLIIHRTEKGENHDIRQDVHSNDLAFSSRNFNFYEDFRTSYIDFLGL